MRVISIEIMSNTTETKLKTMTEHTIDFIASKVMPYATVLTSDWHQVKIWIGDEAEVGGYYLSDRAMSAFRKEWLRRRAAMK